MRTGYCIKCKGKKIIIEGTLRYTSNGKIQEVGKCETCKTLVSVFIPQKEFNKTNEEQKKQASLL